MAYCIFITILFAFMFKESHSSIYVEFKSALVRSLDYACMDRRGIDIKSALNVTLNCNAYKLMQLGDFTNQQSRHAALYKLFCKENVNGQCAELLKTTFNPCIPEPSQQILNQIGQIMEASNKVFCKNNGENIKILTEAVDCAERFDCENLFPEDHSIHLKDFFIHQRCDKYKAYSECILDNYIHCPKKQSLIQETYNDMRQASPCA